MYLNSRLCAHPVHRRRTWHHCSGRDRIRELPERVTEMLLKRLLHVEDHQVTALGLEHIVSKLRARREIPIGHDHCRCVHDAAGLEADVIFLDLQLDTETAMDHIAAIKVASDGAAIAIFSAIDDLTTMRMTLKRGAAAYIQKGLPIDKQRDAIEKLVANDYYFPPELAKAETQSLPSDRKLTVLKLLVAGKSNKVIAKELGLSPDTVETHVQQLFTMLGVKNRTAAVAEAQRRGFV